MIAHAKVIGNWPRKVPRKRRADDVDEDDSLYA